MDYRRLKSLVVDLKTVRLSELLGFLSYEATRAFRAFVRFTPFPMSALEFSQL